MTTSCYIIKPIIDLCWLFCYLSIWKYYWLWPSWKMAVCKWLSWREDTSCESFLQCGYLTSRLQVFRQMQLTSVCINYSWWDIEGLHGLIKKRVKFVSNLINISLQTPLKIKPAYVFIHFAGDFHMIFWMYMRRFGVVLGSLSKSSGCTQGASYPQSTTPKQTVSKYTWNPLGHIQN